MSGVGRGKRPAAAQPPVPSGPDSLPVLAFADAAAWEDWLTAHPSADGLWLRIAKKGNAAASVTYAQALDVALCHGWIDGRKQGDDAQWFLQRFTPRRARSLWSKINVGHAERLIAAGRMRGGGLREIEAAKADGRWDAAYAGAAAMDIPPELAAALERNPQARTAFEALDRTNRYAICWRVATARRIQTREARATELLEKLVRGETPHG